MGLSSRRLPSLLRVLASPVPRSPRYYEGATTSHPRIRGHLLVRSRSPHAPSSFRVRRSAPGSAEVTSRPGLWACRLPVWPAYLVWTRMGSLRSSGDPSRVFAAFQDPGRIDVPSPLSATSMLPPLCGRRRLRHWLISGLTRSFDTRCHTLHAWRCRTRARLASGRPAEPLPGGRRTLWIATKGFRSL